jgi:hypothetical protein
MEGEQRYSSLSVPYISLDVPSFPVPKIPRLCASVPPTIHRLLVKWKIMTPQQQLDLASKPLEFLLTPHFSFLGSFGRSGIKPRFLPYLIQSGSVMGSGDQLCLSPLLRVDLGVSHGIFSRQDAQGFVIPPPREHLEMLQRTSGTYAVVEPPKKLVKRVPTRSSETRGSNPELGLNLFSAKGPQVANFGWRPKEYNEWVGWNRFRGEGFWKERRGAKLLVTRKQVKKPQIQGRR